MKCYGYEDYQTYLFYVIISFRLDYVQRLNIVASLWLTNRNAALIYSVIICEHKTKDCAKKESYLNIKCGNFFFSLILTDFCRLSWPVSSTNCGSTKVSILTWIILFVSVKTMEFFVYLLDIQRLSTYRPVCHLKTRNWLLERLLGLLLRTGKKLANSWPARHQ